MKLELSIIDDGNPEDSMNITIAGEQRKIMLAISLMFLKHPQLETLFLESIKAKNSVVKSAKEN